MSKHVSEKRRQKRHYLKQAKKKMSSIEFKELKKQMAEAGKRERIDDLREKLDVEKEELAETEGKKREELKSQGLKKKEIDKHIEDWYDGVKIWALHKDVQDELI